MKGGGLLLPTISLWRREMVRFFRQRSRVVGSLGTPLLFWLLLGAGLGPSFRPPSADIGAYVYFFPGALALIILFTSIFANISVIEDRAEGFLQGVLAAPVPRLAIVLGKVLGGATIAAIQALALLALAAVGGLDVSIASPAEVAAAVVVLSIALSALGFAFAWRLDSVQGFHSVMNLLLMPMWVLSGALFPPSGLPVVLRVLVAVNPVTYGLAWIHHGLGIAAPGLPAPGLSAAISAAFAAVTLGASVAVVRGR
jgi:ABC-2 type transport system permease protein